MITDFNDEQRLEALEYHKEMESQLQGICGNVIKPGGCTQALAGHGFFGLPKCKPKPVKGANGDAIENLGGQDFTFYESTQTMNSSGANQASTE